MHGTSAIHCHEKKWIDNADMASNENARHGEVLILPPPRLWERLALIPGYTWNQDFEAFHSVSRVILQYGHC